MNLILMFVWGLASTVHGTLRSRRLAREARAKDRAHARQVMVERMDAYAEGYLAGAKDEEQSRSRVVRDGRVVTFHAASDDEAVRALTNG